MIFTKSYLTNVILIPLGGRRIQLLQSQGPFLEYECRRHFRNRLEFHSLGSSWMFRFAQHDSAIYRM